MGEEYEKPPLPKCELHEKQQAKLAQKKEGYKPKSYATPRKTPAERLNRRNQIKAAVERKKAKLRAE